MAGLKIKRTTQSEDIDNVVRYLKEGKNSKNAYNKYITPIVKQKGKPYVDKLIGSTILTLSSRGLSLDDIGFDSDGNMTIVKGKI